MIKIRLAVIKRSSKFVRNASKTTLYAVSSEWDIRCTVPNIGWDLDDKK